MHLSQLEKVWGADLMSSMVSRAHNGTERTGVMVFQLGCIMEEHGKPVGIQD